MSHFRSIVLLLAALLVPSVARATVLDPNTASQAELDTWPGIGPVKASAIISYRSQHPFKTCPELDNVPGIGPATLAQILPLCTITGNPPPPPPEGSTTATVGTAEPAPTSTSSPQQTAAPSGNKVNINTANANQLQGLPGIGKTKAEAIIQYRTQIGGFKSCDELDNVTGIGPSTLAQVLPLCTVE
jgi:competence protein ComEA